ncbi:hypothetical protein J4416_00745 [Candidatus Pacearchaeota archaeon]|nr:hypothetical protein [Candidatus Pacearchaeota archaeon]
MVKDETYLSSTISYIKKNLQKGYNKDSLKWALINQGNSRIEVDKAFIQAEKDIAMESSIEAQRLASMAPPPRIEPIIEDKPKKGFFSRFFGN